MEELINEIQEDINWRTSQLVLIRRMPILYSMSSEHTEAIYWYSVPSIYAIWEGYVDNTFRLYIEYLNDEALTCHDLDINVLTHAIDIHCKLKDSITDYNNKKKVAIEIYNMMNEPLSIKHNLPKKGNIDFDVANSILTRFNLTELDEMYKSPLRDLRHFRNIIAHGDRALRVEERHIEKFKSLVIDLMDEILLKIDDSLNNEGYKYISP